MGRAAASTVLNKPALHFVPFLSEFDPPALSEGSIDPLSLYSIADTLAVKLVPGVRERQGFPRFLTAMAVSLYLCQRFDSDTVAADGLSEPWQVFEWYVVEGLVRKLKTDDKLRGLPGRDKVRAVLADRVPLSADRYLKTPSVFGFHGVYRGLARDLGVESGGRLGEFGYELLEIWEREQGLAGFIGTQYGPGDDWRQKLLSAIEEALQKGAVARSPGWAGWNFFAQHLAPHAMGEHEAKAIGDALTESGDAFRGDVIRFLVSDEGQRIWKTSERSERKFHEALVARSNKSLRDLLQAIMSYERFARLLQDAFEDCLYVMSRNHRRTPVSSLAQSEKVTGAAEAIPAFFEQLLTRLEPYSLASRLQETFADLAVPMTPESWAARLMEHHYTVQRRKPPNGKAPWCERFDDGGYMVRAQYQRDEGGRGDGSYVHAYRTQPLWSFAGDLGWVSNG